MTTKQQTSLRLFKGRKIGIKDKNGRDVREGDFVRTPDGADGFLDLSIEYTAELGKFSLRGREWELLDGTMLEVIGSIHERKAV